MKATIKIILETPSDSSKRGELCIEYRSLVHMSRAMRHALPMLLVQGRWIGEQLTLPFDFELLESKTKVVSHLLPGQTVSK